MPQSHGVSIWSEPAGSNAVPRPAFGKLVDVLDDFLFEWDASSPTALADLTALGLVFTGDTHRTMRDVNGNVVTVAANQPRFPHYEFNPVTLAYEPTWLLEGARTNGIPNSTSVGATVGGASLPTGWNTQNDAGVSVTVLGVSDTAFPGYVVMRVTVTNSNASASASRLFFSAANVIAAAVGQTWSYTAYARLVSGSLAGLSGGLGTHYFNSSAVFVGEDSAGAAMWAGVTGAWSRLSTTKTASLAGTAFVKPRIAFYGIPASSSFTLDVILPQAEQGSFASSFIPTTTAAVTRAAETASFPIAFPLQAMTLYGKLLAAANPGASARLLSLGTGVAGAFIVDYSGNTGALQTQIRDATTFRSSAVLSVLPARTDQVEFRGLFNVPAFTTQCAVAVNGGVETLGATSPAGSAFSTFNPQILYVGYNSPSSFAAYQRIAIARSTLPSLDQLRGVTPLPNSLGRYRYAKTGQQAAAYVDNGSGVAVLTPGATSSDRRIVFVKDNAFILK